MNAWLNALIPSVVKKANLLQSEDVAKAAKFPPRPTHLPPAGPKGHAQVAALPRISIVVISLTLIHARVCAKLPNRLRCRKGYG